MNAIMVLMQVGHEGDWTDRGLPELVTGYDRSAGPVAAGAGWMFDTGQSPVGDEWRLLVWTDLSNGAWQLDKPSAIVTPELYRAAVADRGTFRITGPSRRRPGLAPGPTTNKVRADQMDLGDRILVTADRRNAVGRPIGSWFVADRIEDNAVAVRITGTVIATSRDGQDMIAFRTPIGLIDAVLVSQPVIPVDEE